MTARAMRAGRAPARSGVRASGTAGEATAKTRNGAENPARRFAGGDRSSVRLGAVLNRTLWSDRVMEGVMSGWKTDDARTATRTQR